MRGRPFLVFLMLCLLPALACRLATDLLNEGDDTSPVATARPTAATTPTTAIVSPDKRGEEETAPDTAWQRYENPQLGLAFDYPAGWFVEPGDSTVVLAPDIATLNEPAFAAESVVILSVQVEGTATAEMLITLTPDLIFEVEDMVVTRQSEPLLINGREAAMSAYAGTIRGEQRNLVVYAVAGEAQGVLLLGASPEDSPDGRLITAVAESITLRPPLAPAMPVADSQLAQGVSTAGRVGDEEEVVYGYSGTAGDYVTIVVVPEGDFDAVVDFRGADGRSLVDGIVDDSYDVETLEQVLLPDTGRYFVVIRGFGGVGGAFSVSLEAAEPPRGGPMPDDAMPPLSGARAYAATLPENATHAYLLETSGTGLHYLFVDGGEGFDATLAIFGPDGEQLVEQDNAFDGESEGLAFKPPAAGRYVVQVGGFLDQGGDYTIGMVAVNAEEVLVRAEGSVTGDTPGSHTFLLPDGRVALIVVVPQEPLDVMIELYADGELVADRDDLSSGAGELETHLYRGPGGEVTLRLPGFAGSAGSYEVIVTMAELVERP